MRWELGRINFSRSSSSATSATLKSLPSAPKPARPTSSERKPFCSDSLKVRPMAMVSPTERIWVSSASGVLGNFSKVKRGILVTT